jgi:DNA-binding CsgD family transcriptional regulator
MSSLRGQPVLSLLEELYAPAPSVEAWLDRVTHALTRVAPASLGAVGRIVAPAPGAAGVQGEHQLVCDYAVKVDSGKIARALEEHQARSRHRVDLVDGSGGLRDMRRVQERLRSDAYVRAMMQRFAHVGVQTLRHVTSVDGRGRTVSVGLLMGTRAPAPVPKLAWALIAEHLATALRLQTAAPERAGASSELADSDRGLADARDVWAGLLDGSWSALELEDRAEWRFISAMCVAPERDARRLSATEARVAALACEGHMDKWIAGVLGVSRPSVARHLHDALWKLRLPSRVALARAFTARPLRRARTREEREALIPEPAAGLALHRVNPGVVRLEYRLQPEPRAEGRVRLTPTQIQVVELALAGLSDRQIASRLARSRHTVSNLLRQSYDRNHVTSRAELAALMKRSR